MKKIFVLFVLQFLFISLSFSQERMSFKGISLSNTVEDFVKELEKKGFEELGRNDGSITLQGKFLNQDCYVGVISVANSNTVWRVGTILPEKDTWPTLRDYA